MLNHFIKIKIRKLLYKVVMVFGGDAMISADDVIVSADNVMILTDEVMILVDYVVILFDVVRLDNDRTDAIINVRFKTLG